MRTAFSLLLKQPTYRRVVNLCARLSLALVFITAAVVKLLDINLFAQRVGDFGLIFDGLVMPAAWTIVVLELLAGIALLLHWRGGLTCSVALLLIFISVLTYGIALGLDIECGCFGPAVHVSLGMQLLTDCGLLLICGIVYWSDHPRNRNPGAHDGPRNPNTDTPL